MTSARSAIVFILIFEATGCRGKKTSSAAVAPASADARTGAPASTPPPVAGADAPASAISPSTGGLATEVDCGSTAQGISGEPGSEHRLSCAAGCVDAGGGEAYGTDVYNDGSRVCRAAIHAGVITDRGGAFTLIVEAGRLAYRGTTRHGVESQDGGAGDRSFRFKEAPGARPPSADPTLIEAGCHFEGRDFPGAAGTRYRMSCPSGCGGEAYGTLVYAPGSNVCRAAIHAGLVTEKNGGEFTVILEPGRSSYPGSDRNGVHSLGGDGSDLSFRFER
jgi:LCCL domain-containing protein